MVNARDVIAALQPLAGCHIRIAGSPWDGVSLTCEEVSALPLRERARADQGNVILWSGWNDCDGAPLGVTFWAGKVEKIKWDGDVATIFVKGGAPVTVTVLKRRAEGQ